MNLKEMLMTEGSCAQKTLVKAMLEWWMAKDEEDALNQIQAAPGEDLAGITNSVMYGLVKLAVALGVEAEVLVAEENLKILANATPENIVSALDSIHTKWISDNFTARRWAEKYFKGQLGQYRKTSKIAWSEAKKDLLFIDVYLEVGGNTCTIEDVKKAFESYAAVDLEDDDLELIANNARRFATEIIECIKQFREKSISKPEMVERIDNFLAEHNEPNEIIEIMINAVTA